MAEYDPQRSRPRRRVTDDAGPAPIDEMLDAERSPAPTRVAPSAEVVDLAPAPPIESPTPARRARVLLVLAVLVVALVGFALRRIGASRRSRHD